MCNLKVYLKNAVTYCNFYNRRITNERIPDNKHQLSNCILQYGQNFSDSLQDLFYSEITTFTNSTYPLDV
jgi:hypothetical protein